MRKWLVNNFLPLWAKETVLWENRVLRRENRALEKKIGQLEAYAQGLRTGLRAVGRMRPGGEK